MQSFSISTFGECSDNNCVFSFELCREQAAKRIRIEQSTFLLTYQFHRLYRICNCLFLLLKSDEAFLKPFLLDAKLFNSHGLYLFTRRASGKLTEEEVRGAAFNYVPYEEMAAKYDPSKLVDGFNTVDGEEIFYISNPALGLWVCDD